MLNPFVRMQSMFMATYHTLLPDWRQPALDDTEVREIRNKYLALPDGALSVEMQQNVLQAKQIEFRTPEPFCD